MNVDPLPAGKGFVVQRMPVSTQQNHAPNLLQLIEQGDVLGVFQFVRVDLPVVAGPSLQHVGWVDVEQRLLRIKLGDDIGCRLPAAGR